VVRVLFRAPKNAPIGEANKKVEMRIHPGVFRKSETGEEEKVKAKNSRGWGRRRRVHSRFNTCRTGDPPQIKGGDKGGGCLWGESFELNRKKPGRPPLKVTKREKPAKKGKDAVIWGNGTGKGCCPWGIKGGTRVRMKATLDRGKAREEKLSRGSVDQSR